MAEDTKNQPNYCCAAYEAMSPGWRIVQDVAAGTRCLREQGPVYLPPEPGEKDKHYAYRLARAILFNATSITLNGTVGMVCRNDPKLQDNVPEVIRGREAKDGQSAVEGHWENIDNAGTHGAVFAKELFSDTMRDGHAVILVDMPPPLGEGATAADEIAAKRRPYWVSYGASQVINWRTSVVNGQTRLDLVVFREVSTEPDGDYGEKLVTRYRVLQPGSWALYREIEKGKPLVFDGGGDTSLTEIPVAVVYARKKGVLLSQPPLLDLALTNITHYQKYNDFSIYLHIASRPLLWFRNRNTAVQVETIGAYTFFDVGENGVVDFAETTGAALGAASDDIKSLEERMSIMGLSLLVKQTSGPITATEEKNDQFEESSDLATAARSLRDALELALRFHAQYLDPKATTGGNVELGASLDELTMTPQEMTAWSNAVAAGQYSVETMWDVFGKAGKNPPDFDKEVEKERIAAEQKKKAEIAEMAMKKFESGNDDDLE